MIKKEDDILNKLKKPVIEYIVIAILLGALFYAVRTAYKTNYELESLKSSLAETNKQIMDNQTAIKKCLFITMSKLGIPSEQIQILISKELKEEYLFSLKLVELEIEAFKKKMEEEKKKEIITKMDGVTKP